MNVPGSPLARGDIERARCAISLKNGSAKIVATHNQRSAKLESNGCLIGNMRQVTLVASVRQIRFRRYAAFLRRRAGVGVSEPVSTFERMMAGSRFLPAN